MSKDCQLKSISTFSCEAILVSSLFVVTSFSLVLFYLDHLLFFRFKGSFAHYKHSPFNLGYQTPMISTTTTATTTTHTKKNKQKKNNKNVKNIKNLAHRKFVILVNLSFVHSPGKLEVVHVVDFVESTGKRRTKRHYNEAQEKRHQEVNTYLVICSRMFFL